MNHKLNFIDLFSGAGGFMNGFLNQKYNPIFCVDNWNPAIITHQYNHSKIKILKDDIRSITNDQIKKLIKGKNLDVLIGGPPCQGFSTIGKREKNDSRNHLILEFLRFVEILKPKYFVMENVRGIMSSNSGYYKNILLEKFKKIGYKNVKCKVLCAADYGVPQLRYRAFFIGSIYNDDIKFPTKTHKKENYITVGESINDLVGLENKIDNHIPMNHNILVRERISYIKEGGGLDPMIPEFLLKGSRSDFKNNNLKNFSHVYKRLHRNKPATTMVPGHNAFPLHPTENRSLTVREAARIQTFSDNIKFLGTRQDQCILVGNSVPVNLAEIFARFIKNYLRKWQ